MPIEIFDCEQNSTEWFEARRGIPTASEFACIIAKGGIGRRKYLYRLAAEIITGEVNTEGFQNAAMARGKEMEDEARAHYALTRDVDPFKVGFIRNGKCGASPDALVGDNGVLEIKTQRGDLWIDTMMKDEFPPEHVAQCQGALLITEREWVDISVYWPGMPSFIKRAPRLPGYMVSLKGEIDRFNDDLQAVVEKVRAYGNRG